MYSERWLFLSMVLYLLNFLMTVSCFEYKNIGCYDAKPIEDSNTFGNSADYFPNNNECIAECETRYPASDMILNQNGGCFCSTNFEPGRWSQLDDCSPAMSKFNVAAKLIADCSSFANCGTCTARHCVTCDTSSEFNDAFDCEPSGDACTTSPCGDVCTLDSSAPDGFICSCSDDSQYLDDNNDCQVISDSCSVTPRPIQHYPDLYRGSIIFVDFPFQCGGSVSAVEFYAEHAGTFYFSAWRPSASGDSWRLLGYNTIVSEGEGAQTYTIPSDKQMVVSASDVFGFVYEKGVRYKVISSENISRRNRDGTSSRFVRTRETLDDLYIGVNRSNLAGEGDTERIVPINAIIS